MKILTQRDPRWSKVKLGFSSLTIGSHGCTLTCITMLINHIYGWSLRPDEVNTALKEVKAFDGAYVIWARIPLAFTRLKFIKRVRNYNNLEVSLYVYGKRTPVLVEVYAGKIGAPRHWVLFIGNRKAIDPWTGKEVSTGEYTPQTGYALFQKA